MKALILLDDVQYKEPGSVAVKYSENACLSMGMTVEYHYFSSAAAPQPVDFERVIAATGASLVICPRWTSTNRGRYDNITSSGLSVPVFVASTVYNLGVSGVTGYAEASASFALGTIVKNGKTIYTNGRRFTLSTETAPAASTPIVIGQGADTEKVSIWSYTPDGAKYIYWSTQDTIHGFLHLMVQAAIDDGVLAAPPKRAPIILNIDHANDGGDSPHDGGFQEQPHRLAEAGEILRSEKAICYANLEKNWITNSAGALGEGTTSGDLLANLIAYANEFKYIACHDHNQIYLAGTAANGAIDNQTSKADIDASYQATKTAIEGLGLTVNTDFAHCSENRWGSNFLELAQPYTDLLADPANSTAKAGYGFIAVRVGADETNAETYPNLPITASPSVVPQTHWMGQKTLVRGMVCIPNKDGGGTNGAIVSLANDYNAFSYNTLQLNTGIATYFHGADFEDASIRTGSVSTDGSAMTRGMLSWQTGANYANACPDTVNFGADIRHYHKPPGRTTVS